MAKKMQREQATSTPLGLRPFPPHVKENAGNPGGEGHAVQAVVYGVESVRPEPQGLAMAAGSGLATGYDAGKWAGHDHFKCLTCPYDTFSEDEMVAHVQLGQHIVPQLHEEPAPQALPAKHEAAVVKTPDGPKLVGVYEVDLKEVQDGTNDAD